MNKELQNSKKTIRWHQYLSIISLNENELNVPNERHRVAEQGSKKKRKPNHMLPKGDLLSFKDTHRLKLKGQKEIAHINGNRQKARQLYLYQTNLNKL